MKRAVFSFVLLTTLAPGVSAHEVRPAYLELRQTGPETYDALWKVPGQGENLRLGLYVELPAGCTYVKGLERRWPKRVRRARTREVAVD